MANGSRFLGWDILFQDDTNDYTYDTEIVDIAIGQDNNSSIVMCTIKFSVDTSFLKYFLKPHDGTLIITNKLIYTEDVDEVFIIKLQSVSNSGSVMERSEDAKDSNITQIPVRYMCKHGTTLMNSRVGGIYHKKKLEDIIKDLYKQTKCNIPLKIETLDNKNQYDCVMIEECSFLQALRYLNQQYGLYNNMFLMFGETFNNGTASWVINNINKIKRKEVSLYFTPFQQREKKSDIIDERKYYTYIPINIKNNFTQIIKKVPKMAKFIAFDNNKFMKRKDIKFAKTLNEMNFLDSNKQFKEEMEIDEQMYSGTRFDMKDFTIKDSMQRIGMNAYQIPDITIPNPFLLDHFRIGVPIKFISQSEAFVETTDIKLMILGWFLRIRQGTSEGGGAVWNTSLKVRTCATSYKN